MHDQATWADFFASFDLFRDAIFTAGAAGLVLGWLGVFVVLRRMVFVSAAVAETAALGVALAFFAEIHLGLHVEPVVSGIAASLLAMLLLLREPRLISRETLLALVYAGAGAATLAVGSRISQEANDISSILYGNAVVVAPADARLALLVAAVVLLLQVWWWRGFFFAAADPVAARVQGLPVRLLDAVLFLSIGLVIGVTARALGALPVFAFSTLPAATALLLRLRSPLVTAAAAALTGAVAGIAGYLVAYFHDLPVGAAQTLVAAAFAGAALLVRWASGVKHRYR